MASLLLHCSFHPSCSFPSGARLWYRRKLADFTGEEMIMDFALTPEQQAFRVEIREFLAEEVSPSSSFEDGWITGYSPEFSRKLGARGWIGLTWPKKYGGQEKSYLIA